MMQCKVVSAQPIDSSICYILVLWFLKELSKLACQTFPTCWSLFPSTGSETASQLATIAFKCISPSLCTGLVAGARSFRIADSRHCSSRHRMMAPISPVTAVVSLAVLHAKFDLAVCAFITDQLQQPNRARDSLPCPVLKCACFFPNCVQTAKQTKHAN